MRGTRQSKDQTLSTRSVISLCFHYWAWVKDFLLLIFVISVQVQFKYKQAFSRSKKLAMPWFGKNITVGPSLWQNSSTLTILPLSLGPTLHSSTPLPPLHLSSKDFSNIWRNCLVSTKLFAPPPLLTYSILFGYILDHSFVTSKRSVSPLFWFSKGYVNLKSCPFLSQNLNRKTADHAHSTLTDVWRFKISISENFSTENNWPT